MRLRKGRLARQLVAQIGGIDHGRFAVDGVCDVVWLFDKHELCAGEPDGAVKGAAPADHNHFVL